MLASSNSHCRSFKTRMRNSNYVYPILTRTVLQLLLVREEPHKYVFLNFANVFESSSSSLRLPLNSPNIVMFAKPQNDGSTFSMFNVCLTISPFLFVLLFTLVFSKTCILSTIVRLNCFHTCHGSNSCPEKI